MASLRRNKTSYGHNGHRLSNDESSPPPPPPKPQGHRGYDVGPMFTEAKIMDVRDFRVPAVAAPSRFTQRLDKFEDRVLASKANPVVSMGQDFIVGNSADLLGAATKIAASVDFKALEDNVRGFQEASQVLMKALDEVTKIHPFIAVAVLALKAVISLELTRRGNDKKVIALHLQMEDTMSVLLQLRTVKDSEQIASDGTTLPGRMQGIMSKLADHIRDCGNACDAYMKKGLVVKILKSPIYEGRLAEFATVFSDHRKELEFGMMLHTTVGVDAANQTLANLTRSMQAVNEKLDMIAVFRAFDSPLEKSLQNYVAEKGGMDACIADDEVLKHLNALSRKKDGAPHPASLEAKKNPRVILTANEARKPPENPLKALKEELLEDVDESFAKNMLIFERKLEVQQRQIVKDVEDVVRRSGDLVIKTFISGPHDRIIDPDLRIVWKEMGWKGSVKARHFVLALHDYFLEKYQDDPGNEVGMYVTTPPVTEPGAAENVDLLAVTVTQIPPAADDKWALEYIRISRVQPILEAFDDDGTGFVSLREANIFTTSRPKDWTLPKWLAFWAAGWHYSVWEYREKICAIIQRMFDMARWNVLDVNRQVVDGYLHEDSFKEVELLLRSVTPYVSTSDNDINERISSYIQEEESKLESNLDSIAYDIDAPGTLKLITGTERTEQFIFRLLYLVLKRHLRVIKMACSITLHVNELETATMSLTNIFDATRQRISTIADIAKQQNKSVSTVLGLFAFGMFEWLNEPDAHSALIEDEDDLYGLREMETNDEIDTSLLKYGEQEQFDTSGYTVPRDATIAEGCSSELIAGDWNGHCVTFSDIIIEGLMEMTLREGAEQDTFEGDVEDALRISTIAGHVNFDGPMLIDIVFSKDPGGDGYESKMWFFGTLDSTSRSIRGEWGYDREHLLGTFLLTRTPPWVHRFRYTRAQFEEDPARARWNFALGAIQHQVRQQLWSWDYFKERLAHRKRAVELATYRTLFSMWYAPEEPYTQEYYVELDSIERHLCRGDRRLYKSITQVEVRKLCVYPESCDGCGWTIGGSRIFCLTCIDDPMMDQIDLCLGCIDKTPSRDSFKHTEDHPLIKVGRILHDQQKAYIVNKARDALARVHELFPDETQTCGCCEEEVTSPFWFCSSCVADDADHLPYCDSCCITYQFTADHEAGHPSYVRWKQPPEDEKEDDGGGDKTADALHERFEALEQRFEDQKATLDMYAERFAALETKVDERFAKMEELLQLIVSKGQ